MHITLQIRKFVTGSHHAIASISAQILRKLLKIYSYHNSNQIQGKVSNFYFCNVHENQVDSKDHYHINVRVKSYFFY